MLSWVWDNEGPTCYPSSVITSIAAHAHIRTYSKPDKIKDEQIDHLRSRAKTMRPVP